MLDTLFPPKLNTEALEDIQAIVLRFFRMSHARYIFLNFDENHPDQVRRWLALMTPALTTAGGWDRTCDTALFTWNLGITYPGFQALGLSQERLNTFPREFRLGMAERSDFLGDVGPSAPENWDAGLGRAHGEIDALLVLYARDDEIRAQAAGWLDDILAGLPAVKIIYTQDAALLPTGREHFGYRDFIGQPAIENSGVAPLPGQAPTVRTGEFILGYPDELGVKPQMPQPSAIGLHGSFLVLRKLYQDVAAFRAFVAEQAALHGFDEELLYAKMMGRWRSGAPLVLAPEKDDPQLGEDPMRNNDFKYLQADPLGLACPHASHMRRAYARDQKPEKVGGVQRHRVLRVGMHYGPPLPEGAPDDGGDRGQVFVFIGASIERQFEFVQSAWINDGDFLLQGTDRDPISGANDGTTNMVIPSRPVRYRVKGLPRFVETRGGGYFFVPSINALQWLAHN